MVDFSNALHLVRERAPLVQCITNFVTVNDCANIILAAGGSPSMAHDIREVEDAVSGVRALVCNMGAIEDIDAMVLAGKRANQLGTPVVLDPVAAGGTRLRRESAKLTPCLRTAYLPLSRRSRGWPGALAASSPCPALWMSSLTGNRLWSSGMAAPPWPASPAAVVCSPP